VAEQKPREIAVRILQQRRGGEYVEHLLETGLARTSLSSAADRHLCQELVYGIVRWQATLDWLILRKTENKVQKPIIQDLLRLGLYQIFWLDRIPAHAAVNETVQLTRQYGYTRQAGFINAVLRGYVREAAATRAILQELKAGEPAKGYSQPDWLVQRWRQRWGPENARRLLEWNNTPPKTYARINLLKADPGKLLEQWREENVDYDFFRCDWAEENLVFELKSHPALAHLPSFRQGLFYVQDPSTLLSVHALGAKPGETVLDICAAPGGKLTYIAQLMRNEGRLVAYDPSPQRLQMLTENCARLGVACASILPPPAQGQPGDNPLAGQALRFDRILVDAPCSNTGVMRRRVDLRWRIRPEEIERLRLAQMDLLKISSALLVPGGTLVYSTCSLEPEENGELVREFLKANSQFEIKFERALLPFADGVDGAFVAALQRSGNPA
jgi:16S rRNA (cytosine967-C5)-methyltransferase